jgi:hypothetical protein
VPVGLQAFLLPEMFQDLFFHLVPHLPEPLHYLVLGATEMGRVGI